MGVGASVGPWMQLFWRPSNTQACLHPCVFAVICAASSKPSASTKTASPRAKKEAAAQVVLSPEAAECPVIATVFDAEGRVKREAAPQRTRRSSSKSRTSSGRALLWKICARCCAREPVQCASCGRAGPWSQELIVSMPARHEAVWVWCAAIVLSPNACVLL
jgi:ribosomal protein L40E